MKTIAVTKRTFTNEYIILGTLLTVLALLAVHNSFIQDDAFISFRYAQNLVNGKGLVYNAGEHVEGYTNFLWTMLLTVPFLLGIDAVLFSQGTGIVFFIIGLLVTYRLARRLFNSPVQAALIVFLLGTNYSFSAYATGGLETSLQTLLIISCFTIAYGICSEKTMPLKGTVLLSFLLAAAVLNRMDSLIFAGLIMLYVSIAIYRSEVGSKYRAYVALLFPFFIVLSAWLVWKWSYYGGVLPNTFYVKTSATDYRRGLWYVFLFLKTYLLIPHLLVIALTLKASSSAPAYIRLLVVSTLAWLLYVIYVGGDFMEFRFIVPVLPLGVIVLFAFLRSGHFGRIKYLLLFLPVLGSVLAPSGFNVSQGIESIQRLDAHIERSGWDEIGKSLHELFSVNDPDVAIATTAAGAIPFYSGLHTVDMFGLNDEFVARHGIATGTRPGHQRISSIEYLLRRNVNLIIGNPTRVHKDTYSRDDLLELFLYADGFDKKMLLRGKKIIEIPYRGGIVRAIYLTRRKSIDDLISSHVLKSYDVHWD